MKENKTKVLFLDIDGVLNSDSFFNSDYYKKLRQSKGEHGCMHDPRKIVLLSEIVKKTHCKVVILVKMTIVRCLQSLSKKTLKNMVSELKNM